MELLKTWGSLIVAFIALAQPWVIALWRRYLRPASVDLYETGTIEIGFGSLGPTIGLQGTLRAIHRDVFIRDIELRLIREKDRAEHSFSWGVFRSPRVSWGSPMELQLCTGFLLAEAAPMIYSIAFVDRDAQAEIRPHMEFVKSEWGQAFFDAVGKQLTESGVDPASIGEALQQATAQLYKTFSQKKEHVDAFLTLQRLCYWTTGQYRLEVRINTARPDASYHSVFRFTLTDQDVNLLQVNVIKILQEACGQTFGTYNFVYPQYLAS